MTTTYSVTEEFYIKNSSQVWSEDNKKIYDSLDEAILDFNHRILGLEETELDDEFWDIRLFRDDKCYMYYTTEDETLAIYK